MTAAREPDGIPPGKLRVRAIGNLKAGCHYQGLRVFAGVKILLDKYYTEYLSCLRDPFAVGVKVPEPGRTLHAVVQHAF